MSRSKVISRLRKLLALARSGDTHEAASARSKADALMTRHGLAEADAATIGDDEIVQVPVGARGFEEAWKFKLAAVAARHHGCEALGLRVGKRRKVRLVGPKARVAEAVALLRQLELEAGRLAVAELARVVTEMRVKFMSRGFGRSQSSLDRVERLRASRAVRVGAERYLRHFRAGLVDGFALALRRGRAGAEVGSPAGDPAAGGGRVEGLVRVDAGGGGREVREKLASQGARTVDVDEVDDDDDFDELDDVAYCSGLRQAAAARDLGGGAR